MCNDDELIVWSSTLDRKYTIAVTRTELYHGELTIAEGATLLHRRPVFLAFDALFGAYETDVAEWWHIALAFVDSLPRS
jgi:hypothetical protein